MKSTNKIKLGIFVLTGLTCLILGLYYIGSHRHVFQSSIKVNAVFNNVNGLLPGNNVRFNGIIVGNVSAIYAISDSSILVEFTLDKEVAKFISSSAMTSIGTDGLLGNQLLNISSKGVGTLVKDGDTLRTQKPVMMDAAMRTFSATNDNLKIISENLKEMTNKLNNSNSLWNLLSDTAVAQNVRSAIVNIKTVSSTSAMITGNLNGIVNGIKNGKGSLGALITDTVLSTKINQVVVRLQQISDTTAIVTGNISAITKKINSGKGSMGMLLNDTMMVHNLNQSVENAKQGTDNFNQDMIALKHTWPLKKYFKKQEVEEKKKKK